MDATSLQAVGHRNHRNHRNHRKDKVGRGHSGACGLTSLLKQGHSTTHGTGLYPGGSGTSPLRET